VVTRRVLSQTRLEPAPLCAWPTLHVHVEALALLPLLAGHDEQVDACAAEYEPAKQAASPTMHKQIVITGHTPL
jgi:hypothetical protein